MKNSLPSLLIFIVVGALSSSVYAQVGIGTETPSPNAVLELKSPGNNQGFLVPRLTTAERNAISALGASEKGLLVFDSTVNRFYYWSGTAWIVIEDTSGTGTVTNITTGTGLTGGPITVSGTISLSNTAVTSGTYGSATQVPRLTVDAQGRITGVVLTTIAGVAPGGVAGGDLTGNYPTPTVANGAITTAKILDGTIATGDLADGSVTDVKVVTIAPGKITQAGATTGQVLKWSGTNWTPQADAGGSGTVTNVATGAGLTGGPITATGTISLSDGGVTTIKIADNNVTTGKILDGTIATGDLADGSVTDVKVAAINPGKITQSGATTGQVLKWNGANWTAQADNAGTGTLTNIATGAGLAGGPITTTGTISLADGGVTTVKIADNNVTTGKILDGTIATGDLADGSVTNVKVAAIAPGKITQAGASIGHVLKWSGTAWTPQADDAGAGTLPTLTSGQLITNNGAVNIAVTVSGDATFASSGAITVANNAITTAKIIDGTIATGDLADGAITDVKITSVAPSKLTVGGATTGQVLKWNGTNWTAQADNTGGSGTLTNIATGAGLTGGPITTTGTISLADGGVTTVKIADNNVTTSKILDGTIATGDLADGSVTDAKVTTVAPAKLTAGGATTGQVLKWSGTNWTAQVDNAGTGTLTNIATGAGLAGGPITTTGTISLADAGVTTTKLADGSVTDVKVTAVAPSKLTAGGATNGQVLKFNGTNWTAQADNAGTGTVTSITAGASLTGGTITGTGTIALADNGVTTVKINDGAVTDAKIAAVGPAKILQAGATTGQVIKWSGTQWIPAADVSGAFTLPYTATQAGSGSLFNITNTNSGAAATFLINNTSSKDYALQASTNGSNSGAGYFSFDNPSLYGFGLRATNNGTGSAIYAQQTNAASTSPALYASSESPDANAPAISGVNTAGSAVKGEGGIGVHGVSATAFGVVAQYTGSSTGFGLYAIGGSEGYAGVFAGRVNISGNLNVTGALSKGSGTFKIDHPLDPANKYLYHSFVESPDMKNIYDGVVVLDGSGQAEIELPDWFSSLNKEYRYQLTCIGAHAPVYVSKEVQNNRFSIAGGSPGMKVSWQLTGIRKDPYAEKNRVKVEEDKAPEDRGKYLYPEVYNQPASRRIGLDMESLPKFQTPSLNNRKKAEPVKIN